MALMRYGQAAMIAAIMTLAGNAVWAQQTQTEWQFGDASALGYKVELKCCKDGKCSKDGDCCCKSKKCETSCSCCKDNKCECCKSDECSCAKSNKCSCGKTKTVSTKTGSGCPLMSMLAKRTAVIMVMPASMPLPCCMEAMGILPHPPMPMPPPGPHVFLPPMPIPMPHMVNVNEANPSCPICGQGVYSNTSFGTRIGQPVVGCIPTAGGCGACCGIPAPAATTKLQITATPSGDQLEMSVGDQTSVRCKKMTITIGDNEITVSRFDDRVRVRGDDLKATADCVRTAGKDVLILEGNVVLHSKTNGRSTNVAGDRIELSLSSSAMTIQRTAKILSNPSEPSENGVGAPYK